MSAPKHTPGPWEQVGAYVRTARRDGDLRGLKVANCLNSGLEEAHANARLIAEGHGEAEGR